MGLGLGSRAGYAFTGGSTVGGIDWFEQGVCISVGRSGVCPARLRGRHPRRSAWLQQAHLLQCRLQAAVGRLAEVGARPRSRAIMSMARRAAKSFSRAMLSIMTRLSAATSSSSSLWRWLRRHGRCWARAAMCGSFIRRDPVCRALSQAYPASRAASLRLRPMRRALRKPPADAGADGRMDRRAGMGRISAEASADWGMAGNRFNRDVMPH